MFGEEGGHNRVIVVTLGGYGMPCVLVFKAVDHQVREGQRLLLRATCPAAEGQPLQLGIDRHRLCRRSRDREIKGKENQGWESEGSVMEGQESQTKLDEAVHIPLMLH